MELQQKEQTKMKVGKPSNRKILKQTILLLACVGAGWYIKGKVTPTSMLGMGGSQEVYVLTQGLKEQDITQKQSYIGHVEAIKSVNIVPQVSGYVEKVLFKEGSHVEAGDILFIIEQKRYIANVELRKAELQSAQANLVRAERDFKRQSQLSKQNYASKATFDSAESTYIQAKAAVAQAQANLDLAEIDLAYTEIKAPISGRIGKAQVTEGNYVNSSQNLARIVQTDPIRVVFSVSDKEFLNSRLYNQQNGAEQIKSEIVLPNGRRIEHEFKSHFSDNEINSDTATIAIYAEYGNQDELLIPGNYVQVRIGAKETNMELLVPQSAIAQDEHGNYVMVVNNGIAEQRRITLGTTIGTEQIVKSGLTKDDKVIIQGLQKVSNGSKVKAQIVTQEDSLEAAADKAAGKTTDTTAPVVKERTIAPAIKAENIDINSPNMVNATATEEEEEIIIDSQEISSAITAEESKSDSEETEAEDTNENEGE